MANFREADKAVLFAAKVNKIPPICFEKEWDIVAVKENTYLDLLQQYDNLNILYKSIRVRGILPLMVSVSKKFDLLSLVQVASVGTIAVLPKESKAVKRYIQDAQKYISLYEAFEKNEKAKAEKKNISLDIKELEKNLSLLKKKNKDLKKKTLTATQAKESRECSAEIENLSKKIELAKIKMPQTLSMMGLLKQVGLDDISEHHLAKSWQLIGEYGDDFYAFRYDYITMMGFFYDSVKRGEELKKVFENKVVIDVLPLKQAKFETIQIVDKDFLDALKSNDQLFDSFENPFVEKNEQEVVPPLLPPSSGNIINLLFSGVLNGEMETEDMGKVLVKGSTLKKRKRVDNFMVDTLSQELYVFKTRDYSIVRESVM